MDDKRWERLANIGALIFVAIIIVTVAISGSPPKLTDSSDKMAKYIDDHASDLKLASYLGALAAVPFLWWIGSLWRFLSRAEGGQPRLAIAATTGALWGGIMATVASTTFGVLGLLGSKASGGSGGVKFFYTLAFAFNAVGLIGIALFVGATSAVILRTGVLPKLLAWFGGLVAIVALVGAASGTLSDSNGLMAIMLVGLIGFLLFIVALAVLLYRGADATGSPATA